MVFFLCFSAESESKINAGGRKEIKQTQQKKTASHAMAAIYPALNQQNLDTQLAIAKLLLAIHSAHNSADLLVEAKTLHIDCLTVKRDPLRKHVLPQIYKITDHWLRVHGDLQCRSTWSTICFFFFFTTLRNQCARSRRNKEKKTTWPKGQNKFCGVFG